MGREANKNAWLGLFKTPWGISIIIFILVFALFVFYARSFNSKQTPTGDEPHYLLVSISLIQDGDIDLANNYKNQDYRVYFPDEIDTHISTRSARGGSFPVGGVGLPILLIPFYLIKGRMGTIIFSNLIGALLASNLFLLFWERTKNKTLAIALALIGIFTIPLSIYSFQVYPEILAALIIVYAFRRLPGSFWPILPLAFLPWVHSKYYLVVLVFMVFLFLRKKYYYLIPLIISLVGLSIYSKYFYGSFLPNNEPLSHLGLSSGILGIFVDRQFGLLAWAPYFLFFFLAVIGWWKRDVLSQDKKWVWLAIILAVILPVAFFKYWQAGWSPPPRYLVPLIPLLMLPIAYLLNKLKDFSTVLFFGILSGVSLFLSWSGLSSPNLLYGVQSLTNNLFAKMGAINILPSFTRASLKDWFLFFVFVAFSFGLFLYYNRRLAKEN
jgi:hypothetical protein